MTSIMSKVVFVSTNTCQKDFLGFTSRPYLFRR
ncbi:hypothetical protein NC652_004009 [Populus alba x Populus x berolinensis]|nr:hypothetical protein NC652_004009 [Populus alba x Populus x berolinensis]